MRKRRNFSAEFKARVTLEALPGAHTMAELAAKHDVHSNMIAGWKRKVQEGLPDLFAKKGERETPLNLKLMRMIDEQFRLTHWYGSRQMARWLRRQGYNVGIDRETAVTPGYTEETSRFTGKIHKVTITLKE